MRTTAVHFTKKLEEAYINLKFPDITDNNKNLANYEA